MLQLYTFGFKLKGTFYSHSPTRENLKTASYTADFWYASLFWPNLTKYEEDNFATLPQQRRVIKYDYKLNSSSLEMKLILTNWKEILRTHVSLKSSKVNNLKLFSSMQPEFALTKAGLNHFVIQTNQAWPELGTAQPQLVGLRTGAVSNCYLISYTDIHMDIRGTCF